MFGWFNSDARKLRSLEKKYARQLEEAEQVLAKKGDRALHAEMLAEAERIGQELDRLRAETA